MRRAHSRTSPAEAFTAQPELSAALQQLGSVEMQRKGTVLFREGDPARGVYLIVAGAATLSLATDDGRNITVRNVGPGFLLGLPGTILSRNYLFTAKLAQDSRVTFVPAPDLMQFLRLNNDLCFDIVEMLGGELIDIPPAVYRRARRHRTNA
jgi:CRP-like cAMP-binding protein